MRSLYKVIKGLKDYGMSEHIYEEPIPTNLDILFYPGKYTKEYKEPIIQPTWDEIRKHYNYFDNKNKK